MKLREMLVPATAALMLISVAHADGSCKPSDASSKENTASTRVLYEGVDSLGRVVRVVIADPRAKAGGQHNAKPYRDCAALFGTGEASKCESESR